MKTSKQADASVNPPSRPAGSPGRANTTIFILEKLGGSPAASASILHQDSLISGLSCGSESAALPFAAPSVDTHTKQCVSSHNLNRFSWLVFSCCCLPHRPAYSWIPLISQWSPCKTSSRWHDATHEGLDRTRPSPHRHVADVGIQLFLH